MEILSLSITLGDDIPLIAYSILLGGEVERIEETTDTDAKDQNHHEYGFKRHFYPRYHFYSEEVSW